MMNIGYVSQTFGLPGETFKTTRLNYATEEKLLELIEHNLNNLMKILDYNIENNVHMFRIISDVIPLGSHEANTIKWWEVFSEQLEQIGKKAVENDVRLSMHPGQYTVLNSPDSGVVERSVADLVYHTRFLDALNLDSSHKIILHIGGVYGDKEQAMARFVENYEKLDEAIQKRLIIENDDRQYTVGDVYSIAKQANIPIVFDNLHHECNPDDSKSEMEWLMTVRKTWQSEDGRQKIHYAQQDPDKRLGAHSQTIDLEQFDEFYQRIPTQELDIMFEVKDKNLSAFKGIALIEKPGIIRLEKEWARYKYLVLEHSPKLHNEIEKLLEEATDYPVLEFYRLIDEARVMASKAAEAIWAKVSQFTNERIKTNFAKEIVKIKEGGSTRGMKRLLWKLVQKTDDEQLVNSLYFDEIY